MPQKDAAPAFGAWVRQRRKALDLTQKELADQVGCSTVTITKIESGDRRPSRQIAQLLADYLLIPAEQQLAFMRAARGEQRRDDLAPPPDSQNLELDRKSWSPASNLPSPSSPLLGREFELREISRLLHDPDCRLLTITGQSGLGKTRLAVEAAQREAHSFLDGVFFVPLAEISSPEYLTPAVADAIGLKFSGSKGLNEQIQDYLRNKRMLLVLDNMEQLIENTSLLTGIQERASHVKQLVTSSERLKLMGEWVFEIKGLPVPPEIQTVDLEAFSSTALFLNRARHSKVDFQPGETDRIAIIRICRLLEGLPLGIELASGWITALTCEEIAGEIENSLDFLVTKIRDIPDRHRSLRATFSYSWKLLPEAEQRVLCSLSVFRGGFRRGAAEKVTGASLPTLSHLVDKSLLRHHTTGRYDMHDLVRQFANELLHLEPELEQTIRNKHSNYYLSMVHELREEIFTSRQNKALGAINTDIDNLRQAWDWAVQQQRVDDLQKAAQVLMGFYELRNLFQEGERTFEKAAEMLEKLIRREPDKRSANERVRSEVRAHQAWFTYRLGCTEDSRRMLQQIIAQSRRYQQPSPLVIALWYYTSACWFAGDFDEAARHVQEGLQIARMLRDDWHIANFKIYEGVIAHEQGDYDCAYNCLNEALMRSQKVGDPRLVAFSASFLSRTPKALERAASMIEPLQQALALTKETGDRSGSGMVLERMAQISQRIGHSQNARCQFEQAIQLYQDIGDAWSVSRMLNLLGHFQIDAGAIQDALHSFSQALITAHQQAQASANAIDALAGLALVSIASNERLNAERLVRQILQHPAATQDAKDIATRIASALDIAISEGEFRTLPADEADASLHAFITNVLSALPPA